MAGITIDGLVSGIQTGEVIEKLMQVERLPIKRMEEKKKDYEEKISLLQNLAAKLATLKLAVDNLRTSSLYRSRSAMSSNEAVLKATAQAGAPIGRYVLQVERIALAHQLASGVVADPGAQVFGTGTITLRVGSGPSKVVVVTTSNNSLYGIRDAINNAGLPLSATVVGAGSEYRLVLLSRVTGENGGVTIDVNLSGGTEILEFSTIQPPQNARVLLGVASENSDPVAFTFSSNTVQGLLPGVTLDLLAPSTTPVTVEVQKDTNLLEDQIKRFVESYNEVIALIKEYTFYDPDTRKKGPFLGNINLSLIRSQLERIVVSPVSGVEESVNSLAMLGISLTKSGVLQIEDTVRLTQKISENLAEVEKLFVRGVARNLSEALQAMTSYGSGILWVEQNMYRQMSNMLDKRIASLEEVMALREKRLWRQFTTLETYLSTMKSQSTWLAQQIANLTAQRKGS
ncbi:MAG: flagellar filament capping protein FliD [Candidatus Caldatribacterium sp.]|nr:flagellar filament capping protein FliD [Candidatus Caldatribacterium sp.]